MEDYRAVSSGFYAYRFHHPLALGGAVARVNVYMAGPKTTAAVVGESVALVVRSATGAGEILRSASEPLSFRLLRRPHCRPRLLNAGGFPVDAEHRAQGIGYLAQGGPPPSRFHQQGH